MFTYRRVIPFLLLLVSIGISAQDIKLCTFNIRYDNPNDGYHQWSNRKQIVRDFLNYEQFDFIGMQEALLSQIDSIDSGLEGYQWIGVGRDDGKTAGEFSPIFYKSSIWEIEKSGTFWLSETPDTPSKSWDAALPRVCTYGLFVRKSDGREIFVFNTHYDHIGVEAREKSSLLILDKIKEISGLERVVLMGDFNAGEDTPVITALEGELMDTFDSSSKKYGSVGTFNGFDLESVPERRIDYIFVSPELNSLKYGVESTVIDGRYLSDHFPVMVTIE